MLLNYLMMSEKTNNEIPNRIIKIAEMRVEVPSPVIGGKPKFKFITGITYMIKNHKGDFTGGTVTLESKLKDVVKKDWIELKAIVQAHIKLSSQTSKNDDSGI